MGNGTAGEAPYPMLNSTLFNSTYPMFNATSNYMEPTNDVVPACKQCPNTALCCAPNAQCDADGKCPHWAIAAMGYWKFDVNQVTQRNLSDGSQGPEVTDEEMRMMDGVGGMMEMGAEAGSSGVIGNGVLEGLSGGTVESGAGGVTLGNGTGTGTGRGSIRR